MLKCTLWAICLCASLQIDAQILHVSGKVHQAIKTGDSIELNIPLVGEYYKSNSTFSAIDNAGDFRFEINCIGPKFVELIYGKDRQWILISHCGDLFVDVNVHSDNHKFTFQGGAKEENDLLKELEPSEGVFFSKKNAIGKIEVEYLAWTADSIKRYLLPLIQNEIAEKRKLITNSKLPESLRHALWVDVEFYYANQFTKFESAWIKRNGVRVWAKSFAGLEVESFPMPSKTELVISQSADEWFIMACATSSSNANYAHYFAQDGEKADSQFLRQVGFSYKYLFDTLTKELGGSYAASLEGYHFAPTFGRDRWLAYYVELECELSDLKIARLLLNTLQDSFPSSPFLAPCLAKVNAVAHSLADHESNNAIHIRPDYRNISSLSELLAPYKGKVIYMDLWGTWCGPCADQMQYAAQLEGKFKGKPVLFLYVDDDEDKYDDRWRSYISIRNIEGEHVRLTKEQLVGIWDQLTSPEHRNSYPSYFIIDKDGNISISLSKRPSDQAALYQQIAEVLNR
jgi:thiol-disulfide isomerase/thioredoxin